MKSSKNLGVHHYELVGLVHDFLVAHFDNRIDPISKGLSYYAKDNICNPLAGYLSKLFFGRQIGFHLLVLASLLFHGLNGEAFILRTVDVANIVALDD